MPIVSVFDYPFWGVEILLEWLYQRDGTLYESEKMSEYQRETLTEILNLAATGKLELSGRRCHLEFPDKIKTSNSNRETISRGEFADQGIWPFFGHYVLTPQFRTLTANGAAALAHLPADTLRMIELSMAAATPFRWTKPGDTLDGWRDLMVSAEQVYNVWRDRERTPAPIGKAKRHAKRGEVAKVAYEILDERREDLVKCNGLMAAAKAIAAQIDPEPSSNTVYQYIQDQYWSLADSRGVAKSPTSTRRRLE